MALLVVGWENCMVYDDTCPVASACVIMLCYAYVCYMMTYDAMLRMYVMSYYAMICMI